MDNLQKQFKKGILDIIVLNLLSQNDAYGYEIISQLDALSSGYYLLKEGSLYPVLYRLEDKRFIESYRKTEGTERAVPRKYYRITKEGVLHLSEMKEEWLQFSKITNQMLKG
ncbi:PadR family transcriptional regulator [Fusibacter bizertensis]|uniref:PadR family transcriptional regulator n=1 Tax=Fusibacter bizertensis TaxID=1488331 RepID=A0ABT6NFV2_9FIRM|nr:PadR family transcriptional regulator [Fusibacter bizertensis]MDH8679310.1 PadR family transcriptional regulator [Fusibacter bizertensis]